MAVWSVLKTVPWAFCLGYGVLIVVRRRWVNVALLAAGLVYDGWGGGGRLRSNRCVSAVSVPLPIPAERGRRMGHPVCSGFCGGLARKSSFSLLESCIFAAVSGARVPSTYGPIADLRK